MQEVTNAIVRVATGEGGSTLSEDDARILMELASSMQSDPDMTEAFQASYNNPLGIRAPKIQVWTEDDFRNAALAANMVFERLSEPLQQISQWLHGLRDEDDLAPLPRGSQ